MRSFLPLFNHAVIFQTSEYSWHGFKQIALPQDRKHLSRKSFSIYLYTKDRPLAEAVAPHTTFYVPQPLSTRFDAGVTLSERDADEIRTAVANRDGLLRMYQKLLVEKEQRLRDFMRLPGRMRSGAAVRVARRNRPVPSHVAKDHGAAPSQVPARRSASPIRSRRSTMRTT